MKLFKPLFFLTIFSINISSIMPMDFDDDTESTDSDNDAKSFEWKYDYDDYDEDEINSLSTNMISMNLNQEPFNFLDLPEEIQQEIASKLLPEDLYNLSLAGRPIRRTLLNPSIFQELEELNKIIATHLIYNLMIHHKDISPQIQHLHDYKREMLLLNIKSCILEIIYKNNFDFEDHIKITASVLTDIINILVKTNLHTNLRILSLKNNDLETLPDSIGYLTQLKKLYLAKNKLKILPNSIGHLINLKTLWLQENELTRLPDSIENLINLKFLGLSKNKLTNLPKPIGNLINLKCLTLNQNELTSLPLSIGYLIKLNFLCLSKNKLTLLPNTLRNFTQLEEIHLDYNPFVIEPLKEILKKIHIASPKIKVKLKYIIDDTKLSDYEDDFETDLT